MKLDLWRDFSTLSDDHGYSLGFISPILAWPAGQ